MPEKEDAVDKTSEQQTETQVPVPPQPKRSSTLPVILSSLALLLAVLALAATLINNRNMSVRQPLADIQGKLSAIETRVEHVEASIATNKRDLVQTKLKKMLLNLRGLSHLANKETRLEINKAEAILQRLSSRKTKVTAHVDLQSTKPAVKPGRTKAAAAPPENTGEPAARKNPQLEHQTITAPATMPVEAGKETGSQGEKAAATAGETTPEAVQTGKKPASETPAGTSNQPSHKKPEAPQTKASTNMNPGTTGES